MIVDAEKNEIVLKLVYYGPGLSGKTTNLQYVFDRTEPARRTKMISRANETERLLFFTMAPATLAPIGGKTVRLALCTVPGPVFYDASRRAILEGADGVVFVADTQFERREANLESLENLEANLESHGLRVTDMPIVLQYNKRDLPNSMPVDDLELALNPHQLPRFDAIARAGRGVLETLNACVALAYARIPPPPGAPYRSGA